MEAIQCMSYSWKDDKQVINNYRPVLLLPVCGEAFQWLIFNSLYGYLEKHKLVWAYVSGFWASVNQLLSIAHNIYTAFNAYPICGVSVWVCLRFLIKFGMRGVSLIIKVVTGKNRCNTGVTIILRRKCGKYCTELVLLENQAKKSLKILSLQYVSHLLCCILTMVICFLVNQTRKVYDRKLKVFSTMPLL